ncbi:MAG: thioredoxin family protein [Bacteroidales bacterium]|nr:thioredoxin family protein [Bacteroidales bacterium]MCM1148218.1 thioredoxin family protein [Bacteroidales bacterium]MCM1206951.1 thioredoxin family protein [Bacillota bacterium]MCM1511205.1 thioredoxin family protein [Clostridium sp.]
MRKHLLSALILVTFALHAGAQAKKVYDETIDPAAQIDNAVRTAGQAGKYVVCQIGGNWCPWCLRFAGFVENDTAIAKVIADNYVYIHVNYPRRKAPAELLNRLGNPGRFGYPVMVVLDEKGKVIHIQDSSFLEEGKGYNREKVLRFLNAWTPKAAKGE